MTPHDVLGALGIYAGTFAVAAISSVLPFVATDLVRLVILIAFPLLATWLPQRMMAGVH